MADWPLDEVVSAMNGDNPMKPRLTIVIPTVNRAGLLGRAIESALAQTSTAIEIIVSDNGSTDETPAVIARYAGRGLRTFRHPVTMHATKHGQFLIEQAQGEFFLGLSDDDFLEPEFVSRVLSMFDQHPELSFVYTGCAVHYEDCQVPAVVGPPLESGLAFLAVHYAGGREVSWCACVTRTKDLRELGPQPEDRLLGDMFFWTKLALRGPVGCIPDVLSHYVLLRPHNDNMSHGMLPVVWARESRLLADEVLEGARRAGADRDYLSRLRANCRRQIARSTANQFVWTRIRGASPARAAGWIMSCVSYLSWSPLAWARLAAALILPRELLRRLLLDSAAKLAKARCAHEHNIIPAKTLPCEGSVAPKLS
jgi:glycosyltransferase involved in cell wall biosynthesis